MLRFVDLTGSYWNDPVCGRPICAFLSTSSDKFLTNDMGEQTFSDEEEILEHGQGERMIRLVPKGFFTPPFALHLPPEEW